MQESLQGRVALATGAASGLGSATALALAEAGAHVVIADIDLADHRRVQAANVERPVFLPDEFTRRVQHLPEGRTADAVPIVSFSAVVAGGGAIAHHGAKPGFLDVTRCIRRELREEATRAEDGTARPFPRAVGRRWGA